MSAVLIPVFRTKYAKGWPEHDDAENAKYMEIDEALMAPHRTDAHFAAYSFPHIPRRLASDNIFAKLNDRELYGPPMVLFVVDVEPVGHAPVTPEWWATEHTKIDRMHDEHPGGFVYRTRGGYRIVYQLAEEVEINDTVGAERWKAQYVAWLDHVEAHYGIVGDRSCKDWTRLYRLPFVVRDGERQELETIGNADAIGVWHVVVDVPEPEPRRARSPSGAYSPKPGDFDIDSFMASHYPGAPSRNVSDGRRWDIECPWAHEHSSTSNKRETSVFANAMHDDRPGFKCQHNHCLHRRWQEFRAWHEPTYTPYDASRERARDAGFPPGYTVNNIEQKSVGLPKSAASSSAADSPKCVARVVTMSTVVREHVDWLWKGWIARGMLNLLDGDPGVGKSTATLDIAARITRGREMPNEVPYQREPADVILIGNEDHLGATVMPRLVAAGADLSRVHAIVAMPVDGDKDAPPTLADVAAVEQVINEKKVALVIIDPLMAHLPSGTDAYRDSEMRALLGPWAMMAQRTGVAVLLVRHLRKMGGSALYRGGGTVGVVGAARSAMLVGRDPEDPDSCVLAHSKGNLAPAPKSLRYRVVDCDGIGRIEWLGVANGVTADHLAALPDQHAKEDNPVDAVARALRAVLANGPRPTKQVETEVMAMTGASKRTIERARSKLGVSAHQENDQTGKVAEWLLSLPGGGVENGQDRLCDRGGGGLESDSSIPRESIISLHTATTLKSHGGVEGGGVDENQTAATGSQTVWSAVVYADARVRSLHGGDDD